MIDVVCVERLLKVMFWLVMLGRKWCGWVMEMWGDVLWFGLI